MIVNITLDSPQSGRLYYRTKAPACFTFFSFREGCNKLLPRLRGKTNYIYDCDIVKGCASVS